MRKHPDETFSALKKLIQREWPRLTESDTRSKIIDPLFIECLNWQENDIEREAHSDGIYVDYIFKIRDKNVIIVEAKRKGVSFNIPITFGRDRRYKTKYVLSTDKNIKSALNQAQNYCFKKGVRYGIITNGSQYILFEAYRFGEEWEKCNSVVFYNFDDILENFTYFWNILSKDAVENNSLVDQISKDIKELTFYKVIDNIRYKSEIQPRNRLHRYLMPIIEYCFREITGEDKRELMEKCYIYESEFKDVYDTLTKHFDENRLKLFKGYNFKRIIQTIDTASPFQLDFYKYVDIINEDITEPIVFILLGRIGSGKTTFIHRFFNYVLSEKEQENIIWFYINIRDAPTNIDGIGSFIIENIIREFYTKYKDIYIKINEEYDISNILNNKKNLAILFAILKSKNYTISLVIDNLDQHKSSSPTFHEKIFLEANNLTKELKTLTIIALREESFYMSSKEGVFDAYYTEGYEISTPDFRKLLLSRLDFILEKLVLPEKDFKKILKINMDIKPYIKDIKDFLQIAKDSIYRSDKRGISAFISETSGSNMRLALDLFRQFLISGNTKINEMLDHYRNTGEYQIAYHQFVKSIILGTYRHYSDKSYLMNIFDFNTEFSKKSFS